MQEQRTIKYNRYVVSEDFLLVSNYNSVMEFPFFLRAVINTSSKEYLYEKRQSINALAACFLLSSQRGTPTRAKRSIAAFKLREGSLIGSRTTLRKNELHAVIDKLLLFVCPRLYSEKQNKTILEMSSLLFLNKRSRSFVPLQTQQDDLAAWNMNSGSARVAACFAEQSKKNRAALSTKLLSQQEKTQLGIYLNFCKAGYTKSKIKNGEMYLRKSIDHYTFGIKDLLLIPEIQEFSPLFDTVRGIDIDIAFSNPKVKVRKAFLPEKSFSVKHLFTAQTKAEQEYKVSSNKSTHLRKQSKKLNGIEEKRKIFDTIYSKNQNSLCALQGGEKRIKFTIAQKQDVKRDCALYSFYKVLDTTSLKKIRKVFFLTCFQFPSQYN